MYNVDILGSCVCRDSFNSKFNTDWKKDFIVKGYFPRITIPDLVSKYGDYNIEKLEMESNSSAWIFECYYKVLEKNALEILANDQPDFLIMDFYTDAYLGILMLDNNTIITNHKFIEARKQTLLRADIQSKYDYLDASGNYLKIWMESFDYFMSFVKKYLPNTVLIINGIKGTNEIFNKKSGLVEEEKQLPHIDLEKINFLWKQMDDYAVNKYSIDIIKYEKKYYLDREYYYGGLNKEFVHFHLDYYADFINKLKTYCDKNYKNKDASIPEFNLIKNGNFEQDKRFWDFENSPWVIEKMSNLCFIRRKERGVDNKWMWLWSHPIEVNENGVVEYTITFDYLCNNDILDKKVDVLAIREYDQAIDKDWSKVKEAKMISIIMEGDSELCHASYTFKPSRRFLRIGLHQRNKDDIVYITNICMTKGKHDSFMKTINE